MNIFNPVIDNEKLTCRCKNCFHSFWLRTFPDDKLKCYCELSHSFLLDKISDCTGAEDELNLPPYLKNCVLTKILCGVFAFIFNALLSILPTKKFRRFLNVTALNLSKNFLLSQMPLSLIIFRRSHYGF